MANNNVTFFHFEDHSHYAVMLALVNQLGLIDNTKKIFTLQISHNEKSGMFVGCIIYEA